MNFMSRDQLAKAAYLSFATYRKSGAQVATPVWFAQEHDIYYVFSAGNAGKVKRLRNSARSRIASCTATGKLTGDWVDTEARLIDNPEENRKALGALQRKYGWQMHLTDLMSKLSGKFNKRTYIAIKPVD
jgi:PPOX class probable F420-dependent enzyme